MVESISIVEKDIKDFSGRAPRHRKRYIIWRTFGRLICITGGVSCILMICCKDFSILMFGITDYATIVGFMMIFAIQILNSKHSKETKEDEAEAEKGDELIRQVRGKIMKRL